VVGFVVSDAVEALAVELGEANAVGLVGDEEIQDGPDEGEAAVLAGEAGRRQLGSGGAVYLRRIWELTGANARGQCQLDLTGRELVVTLPVPGKQRDRRHPPFPSRI
jgi:hypothetical protein